MLATWPSFQAFCPSQGFSPCWVLDRSPSESGPFPSSRDPVGMLPPTGSPGGWSVPQEGKDGVRFAPCSLPRAWHRACDDSQNLCYRIKQL